MCILCGGNEPEMVYGMRDGFTYHRCSNCNYIHVHPVPSRGILDKYYNKEFFDKNYNPETADEIYRQRKIQYKQDVVLLQKYLPDGKILDYGCGNGEFLANTDYDVVGYEPNKNATITIPTIEDVPMESFVDGIVLRGVIEHFRHPWNDLLDLSYLLRKGGIFFICATPNSDSPAMLKYGLKWKLSSPPYHLHIFNPRNLAVLFGGMGFELLHIEHPYHDTPYRECEDGANFISGIGTPAYPGSMMSLVFRKL